MHPIAKIYTDFPEKFGLPRQSGIVKELCGKIIFEPEYRDISAVRGLDKYSQCDTFLTEKVRRGAENICIKLKGVYTVSSKELIIQEVE